MAGEGPPSTTFLIVTGKIRGCADHRRHDKVATIGGSILSTLGMSHRSLTIAARSV
jgi:hypothetical protein